jgi:hypothetical protein
VKVTGGSALCRFGEEVTFLVSPLKLENSLVRNGEVCKITFEFFNQFW